MNWDPEVVKYFRKIMSSFFYGLLWIIASMTVGIYYHLAEPAGKPLIYTILFYIGMAITLGILIWYLYNTWKKTND